MNSFFHHSGAFIRLVKFFFIILVLLAGRKSPHPSFHRTNIIEKGNNNISTHIIHVPHQREGQWEDNVIQGKGAISYSQPSFLMSPLPELPKIKVSPISQWDSRGGDAPPGGNKCQSACQSEVVSLSFRRKKDGKKGAGKESSIDESEILRGYDVHHFSRQHITDTGESRRVSLKWFRASVLRTFYYFGRGDFDDVPFWFKEHWEQFNTLLLMRVTGCGHQRDFCKWIWRSWLLQGTEGRGLRWKVKS